MNQDRPKRYWDKINLVSRRTSQIRDWTATTSEDFVKDEKTKLATYKAFQEITEACMDIVSMICKDMQIPPKDDYTNIQILEKEHFEDVKVLIEANGLQNRLVHRYNSVDDVLALESIGEILPGFSKFAEGVKKWIRKTLKE